MAQTPCSTKIFTPLHDGGFSLTMIDLSRYQVAERRSFPRGDSLCGDPLPTMRR
jgi:hypothetical protein